MRILVLSTWFPYPLSQGSKIRAYYLIKNLAQRHEVALISFEDVPVEPSWINPIREICQKVELVPRNPFSHTRWTDLSGWLSPKPSIAITSHSSEMNDRVQQLGADWNPQCVVAFTFITAPYALQFHHIPKIVDIDNLMSPMLFQTYRRAKNPLRRFKSWLAYQKFQRYETWLYRQFNLGLVVSDRDRLAVINQVGLQPTHVGNVPNGVDTTLNQSLGGEPKPNSLVFNGALTYSANYDAMNYFLRDIFPAIRAQVPEAHLTITGATTGVPISELPTDEHVTFSGYLNEVGPQVSGSWVSVAPLRMGGGTRLKILEAMALGTPVVSTSKGAEGLDVENGKHLIIADSPNEFATQTVRILQNRELRQSLSTQAAQLVKEKYDWTDIGRRFCELVENL